jgi:metacaspase-1
MPKGVTINIGINSLSSEETSAYTVALGNPDFDFLPSSSKDAVDLAEVASGIGFELYPLRPSGPKEPLYAQDENFLEKIEAKLVLDTIREFAEKGKTPLKKGEFLLITFSGHGIEIPQISPNEIDEIDRIIPAEASWCFYDRPVLDDEIIDVLSDFAEGVRIAIISDCCFSGTVIDVSLLGLSEKIISDINLKVLEKAVLKAKGFKFIKLNEFDKSELKKTIDILNQ